MESQDAGELHWKLNMLIKGDRYMDYILIGLLL